MANISAAPEALGERFGPAFQKHTNRERVLEGVQARLPLGDDLAAYYTGLADDGSKVKEGAMLISGAEDHLDDEEAEEALKLAEQAESLFQRKSDKKGVADAKRLAFRAMRIMERSDEVLDKAKRQLNTFVTSRDKYGEASMLYAIAEAHAMKENVRDALDNMNSAVKIFRDLKEKKMHAEALLKVSSINLMRDNHREATDAAKTALGLFKDAYDKKGEGKACLEISAAYLVGEDFAEGLSFARKAVSIFKDSNNKRLEVAALTLVADAQVMREKPTFAMAPAQQALTISSDIGYARGESLATGTLVAVCLDRGDTKKALALAQAGFNKMQAKGDKQALIFAYVSLLDTYVEKHQPEEAIAEVNKLIDLLKDLGEKRKLALMMMVKALLFVMREMETGEDAEAAVDEAMKIYKELGDKKGEGISQYVRVYTNVSAGDASAGVEAGEEARAIFQDLGDQKWEAATLLAIAIAQGINQDLTEAVLKAGEAQNIFRSFQDAKGEATAMLKLAELHLGNDSYESALEACDDAASLLERIDHKKGQAAALHLKASVRIAMGTPEMAVDIEKEACVRCRQADSWIAEAATLFGITQAYLNQYMREMDSLFGAQKEVTKYIEKKMRDASRKSYKSAKDCLAMATRADNKLMIGMVQTHIARLHLLNGRLDKAFQLQQETLSLLKEIDEKHEQAACLVLGAEIQWRKGNVETAADLGNQGLELARKVKDGNAEAYAIDLLSLLYKEQEAAAGSQSLPLAVTDVAGMSLGVKGPYAGPNPEDLRPRILDMAVQVIGEADVPADSPLMEAGLDSLAMVQFRNTLLGNFQGVPMPASLIFDHPSVSALSHYIAGEMRAIHDRA